MMWTQPTLLKLLFVGLARCGGDSGDQLRGQLGHCACNRRISIAQWTALQMAAELHPHLFFSVSPPCPRNLWQTP